MDINTLYLCEVTLEKPDELVFIEVPVSEGVVEVVSTRANRGQSTRMYKFDMIYSIFLGVKQLRSFTFLAIEQAN